MKKSDFYFELPEELIAQHPPQSRLDSRLMWIGDGDAHQITGFSDVVDGFSGDEVLVMNDTRVVPARILGRKETGGSVEIFFVERRGERLFSALLKGKKLAPGKRIFCDGGMLELGNRLQDGLFEVRLHSADDLWSWLHKYGAVPLPPYIKRTPSADDQERYQTVYAEQPGAVAAPTAGLHFTRELLATLEAKGVRLAWVTLHVGLGTFFPIRGDNLDEHVMHAETYSVPDETRTLLRTGRPVVAVGTTVVRALESYALNPENTRTQLFIRPGFQFKSVDGLITNFHLPESTLLMMVSAFAGKERMLNAYAYAVNQRMRFFSYGDAMVIRRPEGKWTSISK